MTRKKIASLVFFLLLIVLSYDFVTNGFGVLIKYFDAPRYEYLVQIPDDVSSVSRKEEKIIAKENLKTFQLYNPYGKVVVQGEDRADIKITSEITVYGTGESQAQDYLTKVKIDQNKHGQTLEVFISPDKPHSEEFLAISVDYSIKVPRDLDLRIDAFDYLLVDNIQGDIDLRNVGMTEIKKIDGSVVLGQGAGLTRISDVNGRVKMFGKYTNPFREQPNMINIGDLVMDNITGEISLFINRGRINLRKITGNINGEIMYGEVIAENIQGKITYHGRYVSSDLSDVSKKISIISNYGDIILKNVQNNVDINSRHANIGVISELKHEINAETLYGDIVFADQKAEIIKKKNLRYYKGIIGDGKYTMDLKTTYGNINIENEIK